MPTHFKDQKDFGAVNIEEGGSLTIVPPLIETGSRMDSYFEEFKGTGNSEIVLDKNYLIKEHILLLMFKVRHRKEDLLLMLESTKGLYLKKILSSMGTVDAMEFLLDKMKDCKT